MIEPFLTTRDWLRAIAYGTGFALGLGGVYVGMLWLGS